MSIKHKKNIRRIVDPRGHQVPFFVRLCEAFVDNLSLILRVALVAGGIYLAQTFGVLLNGLNELGPSTDADQVAQEQQRVAPGEVEENAPWLTDGVQHALNCTHAEYRDRHYKECVEEPSEIYLPPDPEDPDDATYMMDDSPILFASNN